MAHDHEHREAVEDVDDGDERLTMRILILDVYLGRGELIRYEESHP